MTGWAEQISIGGTNLSSNRIFLSRTSRIARNSQAHVAWFAVLRSSKESRGEAISISSSIRSADVESMNVSALVTYLLALSAAGSSISRVFGAASGIISQTIWPAASVGHVNRSGIGLSAGMSKGVPSGITPLARRTRICFAAQDRDQFRADQSPRDKALRVDPLFDQMFDISIVLLQVMRTQK